MTKEGKKGGETRSKEKKGVKCVKKEGQACWHKPAIPELGRLRQEDDKLKVSLDKNKKQSWESILVVCLPWWTHCSGLWDGS